MRPAPQPTRARRDIAAARRPLRALLTAAVIAGCGTAGMITGCGTVGDGQQLTSHTRLIDDLAHRMSSAGSLTYTATYALPGGTSATIAQAQNPTRMAYVFPGGRLVLSADRTADCRQQGSTAACTLTPPPSPLDAPTTPLQTEIDSHGLIAPATVVGLLNAAGANADTPVSQHDTTLSGEHATCLDVRGLSEARSADFTACITTEGLLGSFTGTVDDHPIDITLDQYRTTVAPDAFDLPSGAKVVDRRAGG
jgi:hypothetical protein